MIRPEFRRKKQRERTQAGPFFSETAKETANETAAGAASKAVSGAAIRAAAWAAQAGAMYLMTSATLLGETSPFAPACLSAGLMRGWSAPAMLTGCLTACLWGGGGELQRLRLISCVCVCAMHLIFRIVRRYAGEMGRLEDFLAAAFAGLSLLLPGLFFSGGMAYNVMTASLSALISALLAPALISGLGVGPHRRLLMPEEQLSLSLLLMLMLIGLRASPHEGQALATGAAVLLTLTASGSGAGMGALAGLAAGTALTLGGSDPFMGSVLGVCGLLAGCVRNLPRAAACACMLLGNLLTISWGLGYTVGAMDVRAVLAAGAAYCLIPMGQLMRLRGWMKPSYPHADPEALGVRLRRKAGRRLGEISEIFGELADGYGEKTELPSEQEIISRLRQALCRGCEGYAACWTGESAAAGRLMCRMAAEALSGKEITPARELPPDLIRHCRRSGQIDRQVKPLTASLAHLRRDALKRGEARGLMGRQFREAQRMLDALSTQMQSGICLNQEYAALARAALDRAGIRAGDVTALLDDRLEIICVLKEGIWSAEAAKRAAALMSDELGMPFSPVMSRGRVPGECELRLRQAPALTAAVGTAFCAAQEELPCGDSHIAALLPDGRLIAAISDGMGHGEQAEAESRRCISLLRKFVSAGIDRDAALTAVNSLLMMTDREDMFATADLCVIDLYSGTASFSKLGACRSFIIGERGLREIQGGRLPLGILDQVHPAAARAEVHPGDLIVMVSDGIADELKEGQAEALSDLLRRIRRLKPDAAAQRILDWAKQRDGDGRDDMTVIAVRVLMRRIHFDKRTES